MNRPWSIIPIKESNEPLFPIPQEFYRLTPHPYMSLGAPYGQGSDPWILRTSVISRLSFAQCILQEDFPQIRFLLFDAWRPIEVQAFMVELSIRKMCESRGVDFYDVKNKSSIQEIEVEVSKFWASPSLDVKTPPPHSTGAAIDLTLFDEVEGELDMGGEIDAVGPISYPNYYAERSNDNSDSSSALWHERRQLLAETMKRAGFAQHPNEWWHFSYGDQLWAWQTKAAAALYGASSMESNSKTF